MIIEVTKKFIMDALDAERIELLRPGTWFAVNPEDPFPVQKENCARCAVGSVVNRLLSPSATGKVIFNLSGKVTAGALVIPNDTEGLDDEYLLENALEIMNDPLGKPMAALSYFFEGCCILEARDRGVDNIELDECEQDVVEDVVEEVVTCARVDTIRFVEKHFPETVKIDINGFDPAADVKVVE